MPNFLVCSISNRASSDPSKGHYYWMYKALFDFQNRGEPSAGTTIGPRGEDGAHLRPVISRKFAKAEFRVSPLSTLTYPFGSIRQELTKQQKWGVTHVQFYDGGLRELLVTHWLADRFPTLEFVYNFHWAESWVTLFESKSIAGRKLAKSVAEVCRLSPPNVSLTAETTPFSHFLESHTGRKFGTFPIASTLGPTKNRPWEDREIDVLFLPQRASEMPTVSRLAASLHRAGFRVQTIIGKAITHQRDLKQPEGIVMNGPLDMGEYRDTLSSSKVAVLPYDKPYFRWGSSGKFNELLGCGAFPFVPHWTAIASQSNGNEQQHHLEFTDYEETRRKIIERLHAGPPEDLRGMHLRDYFLWLPHRSLAENYSGRSFQRRLTRAGAVLWAFLYRHPSRMAATRRAAGRLFDSFRKPQESQPLNNEADPELFES